MSLTTTDLERLIMLVTTADYHGDHELRERLETELRRSRQRDEINQPKYAV